jgi:uncharacterized protein
MLPGFEWDPAKAEENLHKQKHSGPEERYVLTGLSVRQRLVVVAHTERGEAIRIISARLATPSEKRAYEHGE